VPKSAPFEGYLCHGVRVILVNRQIFDSSALGIEIASALRRLYPKKFQLSRTLELIGSREVLRSIQEGYDPKDIVQHWQVPLEAFCKLRSKHLLY